MFLTLFKVQTTFILTTENKQSELLRTKTTKNNTNKNKNCKQFILAHKKTSIKIKSNTNYNNFVKTNITHTRIIFHSQQQTNKQTYSNSPTKKKTSNQTKSILTPHFYDYFCVFLDCSFSHNNKQTLTSRNQTVQVLQNKKKQNALNIIY